MSESLKIKQSEIMSANWKTKLLPWEKITDLMETCHHFVWKIDLWYHASSQMMRIL